MRSIVSFLVISCALWAADSAFAQPTQHGSNHISAGNTDNRVAASHRRGKKAKKPRRGEPAPVKAVPELDPNAAGLALALLAGSTLMLVDRRRYLPSR